MDLLRRWWLHSADYAMVATYHRTDPLLRYARLALGSWCGVYAVLCVLATFTPAGVPDGAGRVGALMLACAALVIGAGWILRPWPTETASRWFVAYLEVSATAALLMLADPFVALPCAAALGVNGSYIASFHGPKMLFAHKLWAAVVVGVLFCRAVTHPGADVVLACAYLLLLVLVLFSAPILAHWLLLLLRRDAVTAFFDPLTGLRNRRGMTAAIAAPAAAPAVAAGPMSAVMVVDLDDFKQVNDRYGHIHGDAVLRDAAHTIALLFPRPAITARTGGEEFVIVAPCIDLAAAIECAHGLRKQFEVQAQGMNGRAPTVSIGITVGDTAALPDAFDRWWDRADRAMYEAKRAGGNIVHIHAGDNG